MIYLQLFWSFLQIGLFSFGGGYAAMPLIQGQVVTSHGWLTMSEFTDLITISQMTPGPIAVNSATFVGLKIAGIPGAVVATVGCILPSCIIVTILAKLYLRYRYKICKFRHCKPSMAGYNLPLYQRHCCISSTKAEQPYL
jgi:chromate transporter